MIGMTFGSLTVTALAVDGPSQGTRKWHCRCRCGNERIVIEHNLRSGNAQSCGCGRSRRLITDDGQISTLKAWALRRGVRPGLISERLWRGWPLLRALEAPRGARRDA